MGIVENFTLGQWSAIVAVAGVLPYYFQIFFKGVKPERASWFIWTVLQLIAFASQKDAGGTDSLWLVIGQLVVTTTVFLIAIPKGVGGFTKFDLKCLALAGVGIVLWKLANQPALAITFVVFADAMGALPTVRKALKEPETESRITFGSGVVAGVLALLAVGSLDPVLLAYPLYITLANAAVVAACQIGYRRLAQRTRHKTQKATLVI